MPSLAGCLTLFYVTSLLMSAFRSSSVEQTAGCQQ